MTNWKMLAAAVDPPVPEQGLEGLIPVLEALSLRLAELNATLPIATPMWPGPEEAGGDPE